MAEPSPILLISGPPGAGKSTVARVLAATSSGAAAYIEGDTFWGFFPMSEGAPGPTPRSTMVLIRSMMASARIYAEAGHHVIADFSVGPWFLPLFHKPRQTPAIDFVVLCPSEATCAARASARAEGRMPDYGPYRDLHAAFNDLGDLERCALRDDGAEPEATAALIRAGRA